MSSYIQEIHTTPRNPLNPQQKKEAKEKLDKLYKEESKIVKGVFKNIEAPGGEISFPYKKFPQDPLTIYTLKDGGTYDLPLCVAKHLNNDCIVKQHHFITDQFGNRTIDKNKGEQRYQFLSTEYM